MQIRVDTPLSFFAWQTKCHSLRLILLTAIAVTHGSAARGLAEETSIADRDGVTTIRHGGRLLLEYQSRPHPYKAYVSRLFTPQGVQVLRDSPHDHVHHHALMYAIGIDEVDFWSEFPETKPGTQNVLRTSTNVHVTDGRGAAVIEQAIDWVNAEKETLAQEQRRLTLHLGAVADASLLSWQCQLRPVPGQAKARLWGRHYFGLGMRLVKSMDQGGVFLNPTGEPGTTVRGSERLVRAKWCAFTAKVDDRRVTVAMFDAPNNPRHPATWFTMTDPFAYLSATIDLDKEPLEITAAKPLRAQYGVALWDGAVAPATIERVYRAWVDLL